MSPPRHRMPRQVFDELARGGGGADAIRILASGQYSRTVLLLRGVRDAAAVGPGAAAQAGYDLLAEAQGANRAATAALISYPSVGAWAARTLRVLRGGPDLTGAQPGGLKAIAAAAAIRAGLPAEIEVPAVGGLVMLPSLGGAVVDNETAVVRCSADGAEVVSAGSVVLVPADPAQEAPGWLAVRRLQAGSFDTFIDDVDPFRMPAESMVAARLESRDISRWGEILNDTWPLLAGEHPDVAQELAVAIRSIVPLKLPAQSHISTSSAETFGAVGLSQPPDARTFAVTLVHEVQHLKLAALLDIVRLVLPDDGRRFYAPWRDDPRPAGSLLQGAYAHLGVSRFWRRQRLVDQGDAALQGHAEFARWRAAARQSAETLLASGTLTPAGTDFVREMVSTLRTWQAEPVPKEAEQIAGRQAEEHLTCWQSVNGPVSARTGRTG